MHGEMKDWHDCSGCATWTTERVAQADQANRQPRSELRQARQFKEVTTTAMSRKAWSLEASRLNFWLFQPPKQFICQTNFPAFSQYLKVRPRQMRATGVHSRS